MAYIIKNNIRAILMSLSLFLLILPYGFCDENNAKVAISLSLKDAVSIAFKNNKDIQIQEKEIDAAKANIIGARSGFLPKVNLNAGYTHNDAILSLPSTSSQSSKKDIGVFTGFKNEGKAGISVNESIYNGGADIANFKQSKVKLTSKEEALRAKKLDVEFEAKRLYYGLLLAYETERIANDLVGQAKAHYEDVKNKFGEGTSSRFDLLQSKVQVSKLIPELVKSKNAVDLITADLKKLLGLKMSDSIAVTERLNYSPIEINEEGFLKQAYVNKPEMILSSLDIDISKWSIEMAKAGGRPQLSANFNYDYRSDDVGNMFNRRHNIWNAGVAVTFPVFDGFSTKAKVDEARARYAQANLQKENLSDQIAVDIKRACLDLNEAESIIVSQRDNIEEAKEALRLANVSYDNGEGTNLDVLDAQVSLSQIEKNFSEGIYDYLIAQAFLDRTMGKELLKETDNEKKD